MNIALLGSGSLMKQLSRSIINGGHNITVVGTNEGSDVSNWDVEDIKPKLISDYTEACDSDVDAIVMFSYTPLIRRQFLERKSFINIHYALLPRFRGFHGFIWSMINDEKRMGYTLHLVDDGIDSGPIFFQHGLVITDEMNINDVRLMLNQHLVEHIGGYLTEIENGKQPIDQDASEAIYVTKRKPEDGLINWNWPARTVFNYIRALTPPATPGAYSFYKDIKVVFKKAKWINTEAYFAQPGKIVCIYKEGSIIIKCGDSVITITEVEVNGKVMKPAELFGTVGCQLRNHSIIPCKYLE